LIIRLSEEHRAKAGNKPILCVVPYSLASTLQPSRSSSMAPQMPNDDLQEIVERSTEVKCPAGRLASATPITDPVSIHRQVTNGRLARPPRLMGSPLFVADCEWRSVCDRRVGRWLRILNVCSECNFAGVSTRADCVCASPGHERRIRRSWTRRTTWQI